MTLQTLIQAIKLNKSLQQHKIKLYVYLIDLDRVEMKEPKWTSTTYEKFKNDNITSWCVNNANSRIEITIGIFDVEY